MHVEDWVTASRRSIQRFTWTTNAPRWRNPQTRGALVFERTNDLRVHIEPVPRSWFLVLQSNAALRPTFKHLVRAITTGWTANGIQRDAYETLVDCQPIQSPRQWTRTVVTTTRFLGLRDKQEYAPCGTPTETLASFVVASRLHNTVCPPIDALGTAFSISEDAIKEDIRAFRSEYDDTLTRIADTEESGGAPCLPRTIRHNDGTSYGLDVRLTNGWPRK